MNELISFCETDTTRCGRVPNVESLGQMEQSSVRSEFLFLLFLLLISVVLWATMGNNNVSLLSIHHAGLNPERTMHWVRSPMKRCSLRPDLNVERNSK
ncbi:unnamed protein product [Arctogadus glacialis]